MKKSVIILGTVLVALANASMASNQKSSIASIEVEFIMYTGSPLHLAISKGDVEGVKKIIQYGADVNKIVRDMSPLMLAARYNNVEIIKILLKNGARPFEENEKGFTALNYAEYAKSTECIAILKGLK
ncbi:MAG: ankyrin repeat domain-containing protein [Flavobacterium sp.]